MWPGKVLSGLSKRIDRELIALATESAADFDADLQLNSHSQE
jgi:hypothetical protein